MKHLIIRARAHLARWMVLKAFSIHYNSSKSATREFIEQREFQRYKDNAHRRVYGRSVIYNSDTV